MIHVAVGVVVNSAGEVLLARRPVHLHQGGLWEFPGGKVESDEHVIDALIREFEEEVNLSLTNFEPLMEIEHHYDDKSVRLDVWKVTEFEGEPKGNEGQEVRWVELADLHEYCFPEANIAIVKRLKQFAV